MNKVEIIADSSNEFGQRITTAILTFPRLLLAEMNTHRMLSRNSASSRAIRFEKMVKSVQDNPFIPFKFQKDHTGMQGTEYFTDQEVVSLGLIDDHLAARDQAVYWAQKQNKKGLTKQICNRYLEPFIYHTALITGTDLENFFALRAHEAAEIHFQDLAYKFLEAMNQSEPKRLKADEWHIPFGEAIPDEFKFDTETKVKLATVRCARISYITPDSKTNLDYEADLKLHDRLAASGHWSAFEHCARAMSQDEFNSRLYTSQGQHGWCGNFRGFIQYRKMFVDENRIDNRLIKK